MNRKLTISVAPTARLVERGFVSYGGLRSWVGTGFALNQINDLTASVGKLALSAETMAKELTAQGKRLESLESRDGEMWRSVVKYAVTAIVGALIGAVIALIV